MKAGDVYIGIVRRICAYWRDSMAGTEGDWRASLTPFLFGVAGHVPTRVPCATLLLFGSPAIILGRHPNHSRSNRAGLAVR